MKSLSFISYLFFLCGVVYSQKNSVHLITSNKQIGVNELLTITVKSTIGGTVTIDFPEQFELGSGVMNGMEQEMDYNSGNVRTLYYFSQNGTFTKEGNYTFKAFVKHKNQVFKSNSITIEVKKGNQTNEEIKGKQSKELAFGIIEKSKNTLYEGEAIILNAKVFYRPDLEIHNQFQYQPFSLEKKAEIHEFENTKGVYTQKENYKGYSFQTFTYGKQLIFPQKLGKQRVEPFEMVLQYNDGGLFLESIPFKSNRVYFEVLPLPKGAPSTFISAVGKFNIESSVSKKEIEAGDVFSYIIKLSGTGNLQQVETPTLILPDGLEFYGDPEKEEQFDLDDSGLNGNVTFTYSIKCTRNGILKLPSLRVSYFDPNEKKYVTINSTSHTLNVKSNYALQVKSSVKSTTSNESEPIQGKLESYSNSNEEISISPLLAVGIVTPFALGFLIFLFIKFKKRDTESSKICLPAYDAIKNKERIISAYKSLQNTFNSFTNIEKINSLNALTKEILLFILCETDSYQSTRELIQTCKEKGKEITVLEEIYKATEEAKFSFNADKILSYSFEKLDTVIKHL